MGFKIVENRIEYALKNVRSLTGFSGRFDILQDSDPMIVADVAHNEAGIALVINQLQDFHYEKLHIVFGQMADKDHDKILGLLPQTAFYYFCAPQLDRALPARELQMKARRCNLYGSAYPSVASAVSSAKMKSGKNDLIYIGGSTFVVAEAMA
jgi:dihydrofolate synthase/folylpolyglutamate synthase